MKTIIHNSLYMAALLLLLLLSSCEKEVKFALPTSGKGLVLNALLKKDSTLAVRVSFLKSLNQDNNTEPNTAIVKLYKNGVWVEDLKPKMIDGYKYYTGTAVLDTDNEYKVTAEVAGYDMAEGVDYIPQMTQTSEERLVLIAGDEANLNFRLNDPSGKNYYRIRLLAQTPYQEPGMPPDTTYYPNYFSIKNADLAETSIDGYAIEVDEFYTTDDLFDGQSKEIQMKFYSYGGQGKYMLEVTTLTESSYNYFKTKNDAKNNNNDPFTEPSIVLSNVKNGKGIVGGLAYKRVKLQF